MSFHYRGLEFKSRKLRDTWNNRQVWFWGTKWIRAKANRVLLREHTGHSKHLLPKTQEKILHMDITRWSIPKSDWLHSLQPKWRSSISSVQFSRSVMSDSLQHHESQHAKPPCPSPLLGFTQTHVIEWVMPSSHLILGRPLLLLPPILPSIRIFSNESTLPMKWPKYWSFRFSISPSNEHRKLISFRMD